MGDARHLPPLAFLACLSAFCLWIMPLTSSLWVDELVTFWSAYKGIVPAIGRAQFWPGQNTAYTVLIAAVIRVAGTSEIALRLPSLAATLLTAGLLFRLGEYFIDKEAGLLVVVVFTSLHEVARNAATNARPYGIALLLVVASMLQLIRWLDVQRLRNMLGFVGTAAAIPYFHLLFATVYLVFFAYGVYRWRTERKIKIKQTALAALAIAILLAPLFWYSFFVHRAGSAASSWADSPDALVLVSSFMPDVLGSAILLGALAASFAWGRTGMAPLQIPRSSMFLLMSWLVLPVLATFLISRSTPFKIFVPRYFLYSFAAGALIVGCGIRTLMPPRARVVIAIFISVFSIIGYAGYHLNVSPHHEDWRSAAKLVRDLGLSPTTPVLIRVGLIETAKIPSSLSLDSDSPLLSPLSKYPIAGRIVLIPCRFDAESEHYMQEVSSQILANNDTFVVVVRKDEESTAWMQGWFLAQGFEASQVGHAEGVPVFLYRRLHH
jgi:hypothetical protein